VSGLRLETPRLLLRLPEPRDADAIVRGFANINVVQNLDNPPWPYRREHAETFIAEALHAYEEGRGIPCAVTLDGDMIGMVGVRQREGAPYLGYWIAEPHWGRGFATEAGEALVRRFFSNSREDRLNSGAILENPASVQVLRKLGFEEKGHGVFVSRIRNATLPNINMALTRERYLGFYK
jgi:RimJ/RimL family protein N-acetyltransferase